MAEPVAQEVVVQTQEEIREEVHELTEKPLFYDAMTRKQKDIFQAQYLEGYLEYLGYNMDDILAKFDETALEKMLENEKERCAYVDEAGKEEVGYHKISRPDSPLSSVEGVGKMEKIKIKKKGGRPKGAKNKPKPEASEQTKTVSSKRKEPEPEPEPVTHIETNAMSMTAKVRYFFSVFLDIFCANHFIPFSQQSFFTYFVSWICYTFPPRFLYTSCFWIKPLSSPMPLYQHSRK